MAGRVRFHINTLAHTKTHTHTHCAGLSGLQRRSAVMSPRPTAPTICEPSSSSRAAFSKPHTRAGEEDRLGRDLALCASKQKSVGTMNNKSIQKKKSLSLVLSLFDGELGAGGEQLLAKKEARTYGLRLPGNDRQQQPRPTVYVDWSRHNNLWTKWAPSAGKRCKHWLNSCVLEFDRVQK